MARLTSGENPMSDTQPWLSAFHGPALQRSQERMRKLVVEGKKTNTTVNATASKTYHGDQPKAIIRDVQKVKTRYASSGYAGDGYGKHSVEKDGLLSTYEKGEWRHGPNGPVHVYHEGWGNPEQGERKSGEIVGKIRNTPVGQKTANARPDSPFKRAKTKAVVIVRK